MKYSLNYLAKKRDRRGEGGGVAREKRKWNKILYLLNLPGKYIGAWVHCVIFLSLLLFMVNIICL